MAYKVGDEVQIYSGGYSGLCGRIVKSMGTPNGGNLNEVQFYYEGELKKGVYFGYELIPINQNKETTGMAEITEEKTEYQRKIEDLMERQRKKGLSKYGVTLEDNGTLTTEQRIEHLEEELLDGLMYCEHLKKATEDTGITADDYQRAALRTAQTDTMSNEELLLNGVMGLCGEAGEVIDLVKKARFQGHDLDKEDVKYELGDCAWYLAVAAHALGFSLSDVMDTNIKKLKGRYPDKFSKERSIHRKEYQSAEKES